MHPEGELIECQPRAHTKDGRKDLGPRAARIEREAEEARELQQEDSPYEVVQVKPTFSHHVARPPRDLGASNKARARANEEVRDQERHQADKPRALTTIVKKARGSSRLSEITEIEGKAKSLWSSLRDSPSDCRCPSRSHRPRFSHEPCPGRDPRSIRNFSLFAMEMWQAPGCGCEWGA